jgi:putative glutathione S-transferase
MGKLIDGKWIEGSIISSDKSGAYARPPRSFREIISKNHPLFTPETNRYHLYVSYACPWATRVLIMRSLKGLEKLLPVSVVHPDLLNNGWTFETSFPGTTGDAVNNKRYVYELYQLADSSISTSVTVPILWDTTHQTIVNNESSEIIRFLNTAFNDLTGNTEDYYPQSLKQEIDKWNDIIYPGINNAVYQCGFAQTQAAYDEAVTGLFTTLDALESHLSSHDFLVGRKLTEADIRLIPTLARFDIVYYVHFKTNLKQIRDYPHLSAYLRRCMAIPAIQDNHHFNHIKRHYYYSHADINPFRIIPIGPEQY